MPYSGPLGNLVLETANAPGTASTFNLGGAPSGWTGFVAAFGTGKSVFYFITDGVQAEWGTGTVTAGSLNTLSRGVAGNSQGTTQRLNFTGTVQVHNAVPAEWQPHFDVSNGTLPMGGRRLSGMAAGVAADDGVRLDQMGWRRIGEVGIASAQVSAIFSLPAGLTRFRLEWDDLALTASGNLGLQFSVDGGATFRGGTADYTWLLRDIRGAAGSADYGGTGGLLFVGLNSPNTQSGEATFTRSRSVLSRNATAQGNPVAHTVTYGGGSGTYAGESSHVALFGSGTTVRVGRVRLFGT